jgi:RNA polymerase sigma factor (sigma-70 family)
MADTNTFADSHEDYHQAVIQLSQRYDWQLLNHSDFVRQTLEQLLAGNASDVHRAVLLVYSHTLYQACSGNEGNERQNRAYTELFHYLYDCACSRQFDQAEELTQQAITKVFENYHTCRQPGAFLAFAMQQLFGVVRVQRREQARTTPLAEPAGEQDEGSPDPSEQVIKEELHSRFLALADEFLQKHPRAHRQFDALRLKFIEGYSDTTIAQLLDVSVDHVYVLRNRAMSKLRAEEQWHALANEFGLFDSLDAS